MIKLIIIFYLQLLSRLPISQPAPITFFVVKYHIINFVKNLL
nr:MAG TPA: hypothetical protein [Caudoviricetes sp.]